jgi:hypothetical protein
MFSTTLKNLLFVLKLWNLCILKNFPLVATRLLQLLVILAIIKKILLLETNQALIEVFLDQLILELIQIQRTAKMNVLKSQIFVRQLVEEMVLMKNLIEMV